MLSCGEECDDDPSRLGRELTDSIAVVAEEDAQLLFIGVLASERTAIVPLSVL